MTSKTAAATLVFLVFVAFSGICYAAYTVYSNLVTVTINDYSLSLDKSNNGLLVTLSGKLLNPNGDPVDGASVTIYRCDSVGGILETVATVTTNSTGDYSHLWTAPLAGTYYFKSAYLVA